MYEKARIEKEAIERLIAQYVDLKKSGSNYSCCCPFHAEQSPSFVYKTDKQSFTKLYLANN